MTDAPHIDIVFDGPPSVESGRFVEVENERMEGIRVGEWVQQEEDPDGWWRLRIPTDRGVNSLALLIHKISTSKGFTPPSLDNLPEKLMLSVSELAEALEEHRAGRPLHWYRTNTSFPLEMQESLEYISDGTIEFDGRSYTMEQAAEKWPDYVDRKPEGILVEIADSIIRNLHMMQSLIEEREKAPAHDGEQYTPFGIIKEKIDYNASRPEKHGKAY